MTSLTVEASAHSPGLLSAVDHGRPFAWWRYSDWSRDQTVSYDGIFWYCDTWHGVKALLADVDCACTSKHSALNIPISSFFSVA